MKSFTDTKSTFFLEDLEMSNGFHRSWLGSGSTSFQSSVRSPQLSGVKGLWRTEGKMRYSQLET